MTITQTRSGVLGVEPIHPTIGAVVSGVDAKQPLDEETVHYVRQALLDYKVIFLRNQHLDIEEQTRFARHFGELYEHPIGSDYPDLEWLQEQGVSTRAVYWHSDVSFVEDPPFGTILSLAEQPDVGGDTLFADLEAAYGGLSQPVRQLVNGLTALHDAETFQDWAWGPNVGEERRNQIFEWAARKVAHPLVKVHPETGRKTLYAVTGHVRKIQGLSIEESNAILSLLHSHATKDEYVVRFKWGPGDIAFWDNRIVLHRVSNDYGDAPRRLQRVTVSEFTSD